MRRDFVEVGEREGMVTSVRPRRSARLKLRKCRALKTRGSKIGERKVGLRGWMDVVIAGNIACRDAVFQPRLTA